MLDNLKLRNRIILGYGLPIIMFLGMTGIVFVRINSAKYYLKLVQDGSAILENISSTAFHFATIQKTARGYLLEKTDTSLTAYRQSVEMFNQEADILTSYTIQDKQKEEIIQEIVSLGEEAIKYNNNLIELVNQGKANEAVTIWKGGGGREFTYKLEQLLEQLATKETEIRETSIQEQEAVLNTINTTMVIVSLLAAIISLALGIWIANVIVNRVNETVNQVATTSNEIATTIAEQERTISEQASSVNETTTTVEELGATSRQTAQQADVSTEGARQALELSETGKQSVNRTMAGINDIEKQVHAIAEKITRLSEQTGQIASISDLVAGVAKQTNMLALNAAVEAARAGEQGKGFGVVAGEIRKLADQTKQSADKINVLVEDIQASINSTVMVTDQGSKKALEEIKLAESTVTVFQQITDAINNVFLNSQQISMSSKQQAVAVQQVISAMNAVNLGAQENATGISQVKSATTELNENAERLKASF